MSRYFLLFFLTGSITSFSQGLIGDLADPNQQNTSLYSIDFENSSQYQGHPYFLEEWNIGTVVTTYNKVYESIPVRYDALNDQLLYKNKEGQPLIIDRKLVQRFQIRDINADRSFEFINAEIFNQGGYFLELYGNDSIRIFKRIIKDLNQVQNAGQGAYGESTGGYYKITESEKYYVLSAKDTIQLQPKRASFKKVLPKFDKYRSELRTYTRKKNLSSDEGMVEAIRAYFELIR